MWAALLPLAPLIFRRVLAWVGLGVVSYIGIDTVIDTAVAQVNTAVDGLSYEVVQYMLLSGSLAVVKQVLSAYATIMGVQVFKKFGFLS